MRGKEENKTFFLNSDVLVGLGLARGEEEKGAVKEGGSHGRKRRKKI